MDVIDNFDKKWTTLFENYKTLVRKAIASYAYMKPLIVYFEKQAIAPPNIQIGVAQY
jgi:hypothetical protein